MAPKFVAEIGANHHGEFDRAARLIQAAADSGADMVKLQCWSDGKMAANQKVRVPRGPWIGLPLSFLYAQCFTPWEWFSRLQRVATDAGVELFASAFDLEAITFLEELGVRRHKIASFELVDDELVRAAAFTRKPLILSTGMATVGEIEHAVNEAADMGCYMTDVTLLRCVSSYPATAASANLRSIAYLRNLFGCDVGLSDHSRGNAVAVAATSLGATMIERHMMMSRADGGVDAAFSLEPDEFAEMVRDCREAAAAVEGIAIGPQSDSEHLGMRRSLWWARDVADGDRILRTDVMSARPADGLPCRELNRLVGSTAMKAVVAGEPVRADDFR